MTVQPAWSRKISALRRMVFESSITITLTPDNAFGSLNGPPRAKPGCLRRLASGGRAHRSVCHGSPAPD
jgi:hypothetical protein